MSVPVIFTVIHAQLGVASLYEGYEIDKLAFAKYSAEATSGAFSPILFSD